MRRPALSDFFHLCGVTVLGSEDEQWGLVELLRQVDFLHLVLDLSVVVEPSQEGLIDLLQLLHLSSLELIS